MALSRAEALEYLELPVGADPDSIRTSYKRLAQKWHPQKHKDAPGAIEKFQLVALAFKRLSSDNEYTTISGISSGKMDTTLTSIWTYVSYPEQYLFLALVMFMVYNSKFDMYDMYSKVVQQRCAVYTNGYSSSDEDDESDSEEDIISQIIRTKHNKRLKQDGLNNNTNTRLTAEEIEQNAKELISSEEREKKKTEKRRAKKKRQREKKRQENEKKMGDNKKHKENGVTSVPGIRPALLQSSGSEAEGFDPSAAFFTEVKSKKKKDAVSELSVHPRPKQADGVKTNGATEDKADDLDPVILRSRQLAIQGNQMASQGNYTAAIDLFTNAIKLDPKDFRFFGNRSYCFDRVLQYDRALKDAEKAINLAPEWPKGYFRKGRALAGLKLFADAEQAFLQVLKLDKNCEDATTELLRVRTHQLTEMGFTLQQAEKAIKQYGSVQMGLDSLLAGLVGEHSLANEIYESDDEDYSNLNPHQAPPTQHTPTHHPLHHPGVTASIPQTLHFPADTHSTGPTSTTPSVISVTHANMQPITRNAASRANDVKMDPANPEGLTALWVGNVLPEITQTRLLQMFQKYGTVTSIRVLPEKYCAFVNFKTKEAAGQAMGGLQDQDCGGQRLLIKFPDNPLANGGSVVLRKGTTAAPTNVTKNTSTATTQVTKIPSNTHIQPPSGDGQKTTGPINGNECYFWRTTGCQFGDACRYKHPASAEGVDKKPWQLSTK